VIKNKGLRLVLLIALIFGIVISPALAQETGAKNPNDYLEESRRLKKLAEEAFSEADYDKSAMLADEAAFLAIDAANAAARLLQGPGSTPIGVISPPAAASAASPGALPATYTVRPWAVSKDCFWNIAGFPWVYGDPHQWRLLYNANKSKLPDPNNPDSLEPGTVLDIPSIKGELRQGAWDSGRTYEPIR
jgi:nucleoid-associated protein YgaU